MHIAVIHNSKAFGGAERYTVDIARGLAESGNAVTLLCPAGCAMARKLAGSKVNVVPVGMGMVVGWHSVIGPLNDPLFWVDLYANPLRARFARTIRAIHSDRPIDLFHVQFIKDKMWVGALGRELGVPVAWTVHAPLEPWMRRGVAGEVNRIESASVAGVISVSQATAADVVAFGVPVDRVRVVYNGLHAEDFAAGRRDAVRCELGLEDEILVLVPARPYAGKGIGVVLEAARSLDDALPGTFSFAVAGESRHRPAFAEQARRMGLANTVRFLGHRDDMTDLYAAADIVCLPSMYEGLPYAISEGMAAGRPVVATAVGGVPEMVLHGETGLLIPPSDAATLATALRSLADLSLRQRFGVAGRERAKSLFFVDRMVSETEKVLDAAVRRARCDPGLTPSARVESSDA